MSKIKLTMKWQYLFFATFLLLGCHGLGLRFKLKSAYWHIQEKKAEKLLSEKDTLYETINLIRGSIIFMNSTKIEKLCESDTFERYFRFLAVDTDYIVYGFNPEGSNMEIGLLDGKSLKEVDTIIVKKNELSAFKVRAWNQKKLELNETERNTIRPSGFYSVNISEVENYFFETGLYARPKSGRFGEEYLQIVLKARNNLVWEFFDIETYSITLKRSDCRNKDGLYLAMDPYYGRSSVQIGISTKDSLLYETTIKGGYGRLYLPEIENGVYKFSYQYFGHLQGKGSYKLIITD